MTRPQRLRAAISRDAEYLDIQVEGAGLAVANPMRRQPLAVPRDIRLGDTPEGGEAILWAMPPSLDEYGLKRDWAEGGTAEQAFWEFLELAEEQRRERFVAFARRFGVLGLWPYETPDGHKVFGLDFWVPSVAEGVLTPDRYVTMHGDEYWHLEAQGLIDMMYEPVSEWRRWARWLRATVMIAFALRSGRVARREDWEAIGYRIWFEPARWKPPAPRFSTDLDLQCRELVGFVQQRFLKWSGLVPTLNWTNAHPILTLALGGRDAVLMPRTSMQHDWPENSLFPSLVGQLVAVVCADDIGACSRCGTLHPRKRKAREDQPAYCPACRVEARRKTKRESNARARRRPELTTVTE